MNVPSGHNINNKCTHGIPTLKGINFNLLLVCFFSSDLKPANVIVDETGHVKIHGEYIEK